VKRALPPIVAIGAVLAVLVPYLALGGASYEPTPVADPCALREWRDPGDLEEVLEQVALSALDGTACALGVSREDLVLAVGDEVRSTRSPRRTASPLTSKKRSDGLTQAIDDAEQAGSLSGASPRSHAGRRSRSRGSCRRARNPREAERYFFQTLDRNTWLRRHDLGAGSASRVAQHPACTTRVRRPAWS
jgi:hypothetical protein